VLLGSLLLLILLLLWPQLHPEAIFNFKYSLWLDMALHAICYGVIATIIWSLFANGRNRLLLFITICLFSLLLEWLQTFIPGRSFSVTDLAANGIGITTAFGFFILRNQLRQSAC